MITYTHSDSKTSTIFDNKTFTSYLMAAEAKDKDVATRISDDATKFFNNVTHSSTSSYVDVILNTSCLMEYINMLQQQNLAPSTIIDKLRNLRLVIDYIGCKENATMTDKELGCKCEVVQKWLQKRSKALRKDLRMQKFANAIKGEQDVQNADDPTKFIIDADVQNEIFRILAKSETEVISKNEHNTVIAYLAATIIYKNSQRPGVIENMSIEEFECRKIERKNRILIRVLRHKTASSTGPANIIINKHCEDVMSQYYNSIRLKISAQNKELASRFFLTNTGTTFRKVSELIQKVAETFGIKMPTASLHRKVMATTAHSDDTMPESKMRALNKHMSHSASTSEKYYQLPGAKTAVEMYDTIKKLTKRKFFTHREDEILTKEWPLQKGTTPKLQLCRKIVEHYGIERTAKQLQDRWLTLSKHI